MDNIDLNPLDQKNNEEIIPYDILEHAIVKWVQQGPLNVPIVTTELSNKDYLGTLKIRCGFSRDQYKIPTGLYGIGQPGQDSEVLVSANYKYTFDVLRRDLKGLNLWILILDTQGINVWCAAGKGTFSSRELIYQVKKCHLKEWLKHRRLILPQLGAASIEPHLVRKHSGFKIEYGPVRSGDLKAYFDQNRSCNESMRQVTFNLKERAELIPVEVKNSIKYFLGLSLCLYILSFIGPNSPSIRFSQNILAVAWAFFLGTVAFPIVLPMLPFNRFTMKGWFLGIIGGLTYMAYMGTRHHSNLFTLQTLGSFIGIQVIVSALGLIFTGSTPYTSYSNVDKETRKSLPYYLIWGLSSICLIIVSNWI